jgi:simple sugar transport system permease protein
MPEFFFLENLLRSGLKLGAPLWLAALGESFAERSGVINIGLEGMMLTGAFAGFVVGFFSGSPWLGLLVGIFAGLLMAWIFALLTVRMAGDQIIIGTAINLIAIGLTGFLYRRIFGLTGSALTVQGFAPVKIEFLDFLPLFSALSNQPAPLYFALLLLPLAWFIFNQTHLGLAIRAAGESPATADTAGLDVTNLRLSCVLVSGGLAGAAGAYLSLAHANTFIEGMTAGRGFIALAIIIFGRWQPTGIFFASILFGTANALQFQFQAQGYQLPYQFLLMFPYVLTLVVLVVLAGKSQAPAALAKFYSRE